MLQHTIEVLGFEKVLNYLKEKTISRLGEEAIENLTPSTNIKFLETQLAQISEMRDIYAIDGYFPIRGIKDIRSYYKRAEIEGAFLEPAQLYNVAMTLEVARNIKDYLKKRQKERPMLNKLAEPITPLRGIESRILEMITPEGEVKDDATPKLSKIRRNYYRVRDKIHQKLEKIMQADATRSAVQDQLITLRDDRFVIPIRSNMRSKVKGIIHDESGSGATVFIEPFATVKLNNELRELVIEERKEIQRILKELTALIRENLPEIRANIEILQDFEVIYAKHCLAEDLDCLSPKLNEDNYLCLEKARHPILEVQFNREWEEKGSGEKKKVIPLDIFLDRRVNTIVITGPNTGGKTVALKTLGLMCLMAQCGMQIPAGVHTELPIFEKILADIGDEQSIEQNLSTFSSHMAHIIEIVENADDKTLVLLDEIGAGTDPDQGAALGMAILDDLSIRDTLTVATTHYGSLKAFAHNQKKMENACMEFDSVTLQPTYHLLMGVPGSSKAFEIAKRLGLNKTIIGKASKYLGSEGLEISELITHLQEQSRIIREKREAIETKETDLEKLLERHEEKMANLKKETQQIKKEALEEAEKIVNESNALIERTIADLRKTQANKESIEKARRELKKEKENIQKSLGKFKQKAKPKAVIKPEVGQKVMLDKFEREAVVQSEPDEDGNLQIAMGNIHMEVPVSDISLIEDGKNKKKVNVVTTNIAPAMKLELDLRGYTFDEAEIQIEKYLDEALIAGIDQVRLIHGKGTGALRRKIRKMLDYHSLVKEHHLAPQHMGGSGVTIVTLIE